jgi:hypothetical protein
VVHGKSEIDLAKLLILALGLLIGHHASEYSDLKVEICYNRSVLISVRQFNCLGASIGIDLTGPAVAAEQLLVAASQPKIRSIPSVSDKTAQLSISELRRDSRTSNGINLLSLESSPIPKLNKSNV